MPTELEILEKVAATTKDPKVKAMAEKVIAAMKAHRPRSDGKRAVSGLGDRVLVKVQRAGDKSAN